MRIEIHPLVPNAVLPVPATARTRDRVPSGYGVQEHCLPFTAAAAAGVIVPAPFTFGYGLPVAVPAGARAFLPPRRAPGADPEAVFYVVDAPASAFVGNAYRLVPIGYRDPEGQPHTHAAVQPGLSFFDRDDQADMFKIHLPFVIRTPEAVDSLFTTLANRPSPLDLVTGLVETDWYAHPVSLIVRLPATGGLHIAAGDPIAQVLFMHRSARQTELEVVAPGTAASVPVQADLLRWYASHANDRGAYKALARSRHGRFESGETT
jgi:hypothetical protein